MEKGGIVPVLRFLRMLLGELAAASLIAVIGEATNSDWLTLTSRSILFIIIARLYMYLDEVLQYD